MKLVDTLRVKGENNGGGTGKEIKRMERRRKEDGRDEGSRTRGGSARVSELEVMKGQRHRER